jgi:hypothetical protein
MTAEGMKTIVRPVVALTIVPAAIRRDAAAAAESGVGRN